MIFVDTSAWFASVVPWDADHASAAEWLRRNTRPLVTTDYVVDETLTLLRARGEASRALSLGKQFFVGSVSRVYRLTESDLMDSWQVFQQFADKDWSFTDCTSKVVIEKLGLTTAFAFDQDFRQFGTVVVVP